jgi:hypothetical protein
MSERVSRKTFLRGVAGVAAGVGTRGLRTTGSPTRQANAARPARPHAGQRASVTVDLSSTTGKTIQPYLYGYATGALMDNNFQLAATEPSRDQPGNWHPPKARLMAAIGQPRASGTVGGDGEG